MSTVNYSSTIITVLLVILMLDLISSDIEKDVYQLFIANPVPNGYLKSLMNLVVEQL